ncbi:helix-turn-helix transcriptional regulator [Actinoplanes capillaceus]|uniref:Helix-turn-helix transcriptional regulator n=1 Tax=Actinoplanes campanulatus TaxID=113559 RepID=A0ABQ3WR35_9ACTN|nr:helix-turn-helix transcriptional regulator [Actinoplanes capillaceus]
MPSDRLRLVGRDRELNVLTSALEAAAAGRPGTAIVTGEAGIGKTRLVEELIDRAEAAGSVVASGACSPVSTRLPYGPVVDLVSGLLRQVPDLPELVPEEAWSAVAPLTGVRVHARHLPDPRLGSTRLFIGFVELLAAASARRPALLVVEDIHWADPASIDLLAFAAHRFRHEQVVLVLTNRPAGVRPAASLRPALGELRRIPTTVEVSVEPLPPSSIRELVEERAGASAPARFDEIVRRSGGIPFFALHLATHHPGQVSPHLRDVLLSSLEDLPREAKELLVLLTVIGDANEAEVLLAASAASPEEFNERARALTDRGLTVVNGESIGFRHALLREVVVADTLPSERRLAHARAAGALLRSAAAHQPHRAAQLAHHLMECGRHDEALHYALRGARHTCGVWAFTDASELYAAALRLWPLAEDAETATGLTYPQLLREAAMTSRWHGGLDEALRLIREALALADVPPEVRAESEHTYGQILWAAGDMGTSLAAHRRAEALLPTAGHAKLRSAVLAALAHGLMVTGKSKEAERTARAAIDLAAASGADRERIHASITAAAARAQLGDVGTAVLALRECLPLTHQLDDIELVVRCYGNLTFALGIACRYEELASAAADGLRACRRYGPVVSLASTLMNNQVQALVTLGRWDEAVQVASAALDEATAGSVGLHLRIALADVAVARGNAEEADRLLAQANELGADDPYLTSALSVVRAERALWDRQPHVAASAVAAALPSLRAQDDGMPLLEACWLGLRAAADVAESQIPRRPASRPSAAAELLDLAHRAAVRTALPVASVILSQSRLEAHRISGADLAAEWAAAAAANAELRRPYFRAYCLFRQGAAELRRQARAAARTALGEGLQLADTLGAGPLATEIRTLASVADLRLDGATTAHPAAGPTKKAPYGLTVRECEILELLTTGATNRQIGRSLFISERTASVHVSNILAKLGAANRTEAARIALRMNIDTSPWP